MPRKPRESSTSLDRQDRAILRILQRDNKTPQREIADEVKLSAAAVQRRIVAMESSGVITRNVAIVNPEAISATITAIVEITLQDERATTVDRARDIFRASEEVQQCYYVTGGVSFVLIIVAADMRSYEGLTRRLFAENDLVKSYRTLVTLNRVKVDTSIVIP